MWHSAYLAVSAALGLSIDDAEAGIVGPLDAEGRAVSAGLRSPERRDRTLALARPLAQVNRAVDAARLQ